MCVCVCVYTLYIIYICILLILVTSYFTPEAIFKVQFCSKSNVVSEWNQIRTRIMSSSHFNRWWSNNRNVLNMPSVGHVSVQPTLSHRNMYTFCFTSSQLGSFLSSLRFSVVVRYANIGNKNELKWINQVFF